MPTKIEFQTYDGEDDYGPKELIGYCQESPMEVLRGVFATHAIRRYGKLGRPVDTAFPNNALGLVITEVEADSPGGSISSVKDLDLDRARLELQSSRTETTYRNALREATNLYLFVTFEGDRRVTYLDIRDDEKKSERKNKHYEESLAQLFQVAGVTLDIEEPTVEDLQRVLRGE